MSAKRFMFREKKCDDNFKDGRTYHSAGIVHSVDPNAPLTSGKDVSVEYIDPFTFDMCCSWLSIDEVELFECGEWEWDDAKKSIDSIKNLSRK